MTRANLRSHCKLAAGRLSLLSLSATGGGDRAWWLCPEVECERARWRIRKTRAGDIEKTVSLSFCVVANRTHDRIASCASARMSGPIICMTRNRTNRPFTDCAGFGSAHYSVRELA